MVYLIFAFNVHIKTSHGEEAVMTIRKQRGTIDYRSVLRGKVETATWTYEPDKFVRQWIQRNEQFTIPASIEYTNSSGDLIVRKKGVGEIYRETVRLPKGIKLEVLLEKYLRISDAMGKKFSQSSFMGNIKSDYVLVDLNPFGIDKNQVHFGYTIGDMSSGFGILQKFIDRIMLDSIYKQEFDEKSNAILIGKKFLTARGPNRNGHYELTSGQSSIIYNPNNGSVTLGRQWSTKGVLSSIIEGNLGDGYLDVFDDYGKGKYQVWRLNLNFGNKDTNKSYSVILIEDKLK